MYLKLLGHTERQGYTESVSIGQFVPTRQEKLSVRAFRVDKYILLGITWFNHAVVKALRISSQSGTARR